MVGSFRRRLLAIAALTVLACGVAISAILFLARMTLDDRTAHARDNVTREVEHLRGAMEAPSERAHPDRQSGELRSGYVADSALPDKRPFIFEALHEATSAG